jgi:undecaprenyl-diphosphatase
MNVMVILFVLAVVQALAEFLPVSSSGHLVIIESIPWFRDGLAALGDGLTLFINVMLHLATLVAVLIFLREDIARLLKGAAASARTRDFSTPEARSIGYILAASVPAGVIGVIFHDFFESLFSSPGSVFVLLIVNGIILLSTRMIPVGSRKIEEAGLARSLLVGFFQALAILPGISRSGLTITGGFIAGMEPVEAAKFSFLMALPVIAGAGLLEGIKAVKLGLPEGFLVPLAGAMVLAVVLALFSLKLLMAIVKRIRIDVFGYYTIALGIAGLIILRVF